MDATSATWLSVATRRVLSNFLKPLAAASGWRKLYLISPWISELPLDCGLTLPQLVKGLIDDGATAYIVTRPPRDTDPWHAAAVKRLAESGMASIKYNAHLHTKLFCAHTLQSNFALLGSANLTAQSFINIELGVSIRDGAGGTPIFKVLANEAAAIYRSAPGRPMCERRFDYQGKP